jgi:IrrE N-terminal-like domain
VRRGFKEEAKRLALEVRAELGLGSREPLDSRELANLYGIRIFPLHELGAFDCPAEAVAHFAQVREETFSAALIPLGTARLIIENSAHADTRREVSIAHEIAHVILEHEFSTALLTLDGCRSVGREIEEEADRLGGELLIPYQAALAAAHAGWSDLYVGHHYGVSQQFAAMRMNASGARKVATRQRIAYQRTVRRSRTEGIPRA